MPMLRRQIVCRITIGGQPLNQWFGLRISNALDTPAASAQITALNAVGNFDDEVVITAGAIPGNGLVTRFDGRRRQVRYDLYPRGCTIECIGELQRAAEFLNTEDPIAHPVPAPGGIGDLVLGQGGLRVQDLVPDSGHIEGTATFLEIAQAVFKKADVAFDADTSECSQRTYGSGLDDGWRFMWKAGTGVAASPGRQGTPLLQSFRRAGESALEYLQKYSQIDAIYVIGPPNKIGFYRIFELPSGKVVIRRIGGHPGSVVSTDSISGRYFVFTEGGSENVKNDSGGQFNPDPGTPNILTANISRDYPLGCRSLVVGTDLGNYQVRYEAQSQNDFMPAVSQVPFVPAAHWDPQPPSSEWIDWQTFSGDVAPYNKRRPHGLVTADATDSDTSLSVAEDTPWPEAPFQATIAETGEVVTVNSDSGGTWDITRGDDPKAINTNFNVRGPFILWDPNSLFGMDCETVAKTRLTEINRETVSGTISIADDCLIEIGQVHRIQAPAGEADRLNTGENLWCVGNDFEIQVQNEAPVLTQNPKYLGGGEDVTGPELGQGGDTGSDHNNNNTDTSHAWTISIVTPADGASFTEAMDVNGDLSMDGAQVPTGTTVQLVLVDNTTSQTATGTGSPYPVDPDGLVSWSGQLPWRSDITEGDDMSITAYLHSPSGTQVAQAGPVAGVSGQTGGSGGTPPTTDTWDIDFNQPTDGDVLTASQDVNGGCHLNGGPVPSDATIQIILVDNTTGQTATSTGHPYPAADQTLTEWSGVLPWRGDISSGDDLSVTARLLNGGLSVEAQAGPVSGSAA